MYTSTQATGGKQKTCFGSKIEGACTNKRNGSKDISVTIKRKPYTRMTLYYDVALVCRIDKEFAEAPDGKVQKQAAASRSPLASGGSAILYPSLSILG